MATDPTHAGAMPQDMPLHLPGMAASLDRQQMPTRQILQAQKLETIGYLAGGLAHDLNNQLLVIRGCIELCRLENTNESVSGQLLKQARLAADKAANLTRQILLFARQQPCDKRLLDLNENVRSLQGMLSRLMGENISLILDLADPLWPINADSTNMDQVITNLLINARDAMPMGGAITVRTESVTLDEAFRGPAPGSRTGRYVHLAVSDTGKGIPDNVMPHIFEPFFTTKPTGTGLGLSVTYGIVTTHDGWIVAKSAPGEGSTFDVYLPAPFVPADSAIPSFTGDSCPDAPPKGRGERILLVEDDPNVRALTEKVLQANDYVVYSCGAVSEAIEMSRSISGKLDLVISDMVLPDGSGRGLAQRLALDGSSAGILLVSGYPDGEPHGECAGRPDLPFLQKPYTFDALLHKVQEVLAAGETNLTRG